MVNENTMSNTCSEILEKEEAEGLRAAQRDEKAGLNTKRDKVLQRASHLRTKLDALRKLCVETERTDERANQNVYDRKELEGTIKCLLSEKEVMERNIQSSKQKIAELEHRNESLLSQNEALERYLLKIEAERNAASMLERENESLRLRNRTLQGQCHNLEAEINAAAALEKEKAQSRISELKEENNSLRSRNGSLEGQLHNLKAKRNASIAWDKEIDRSINFDMEEEKRSQIRDLEGEPHLGFESRKESALGGSEDLEYQKDGMSSPNRQKIQRVLLHFKADASAAVGDVNDKLSSALHTMEGTATADAHKQENSQSTVANLKVENWKLVNKSRTLVVRTHSTKAEIKEVGEDCSKLSEQQSVEILEKKRTEDQKVLHDTTESKTSCTRNNSPEGKGNSPVGAVVEASGDKLSCALQSMEDELALLSTEKESALNRPAQTKNDSESLLSQDGVPDGHVQDLLLEMNAAVGDYSEKLSSALRSAEEELMVLIDEEEKSQQKSSDAFFDWHRFTINNRTPAF